jgi:hypothetical protein
VILTFRQSSISGGIKKYASEFLCWAAGVLGFATFYNQRDILEVELRAETLVKLKIRMDSLTNMTMSCPLCHVDVS